jgi:ribonuclease HI
MGWKPKIKTKIASNVDKAIEDANNDNPDVKVFTDSSGMEGKIGAVAVLYRNGRAKTTLCYQVGSQKHHTVYEGEGIGVILAMKLISKEWGIRSAIIYTDNQAAITATQLMKPNPGHHIFDALHDNIEELRKKHIGICITIQWIPGHKGVEGNELADEQAKKAITEGSSNVAKLPRALKKALPHSKSAVKCAYGEKLKRNAQKAWQKSPQYKQMKSIDPTTPSRKYIDLITDLPWKIASILSQLRTGHAPLAKYLHHIGKIDSPLCPGCQQSEETVQHLLLHCTAHQAARQALCNSTGGRDINITKLLTTPKTLPALFHYIAATG